MGVRSCAAEQTPAGVDVQIADALRFLAENACNAREEIILHGAFLLCQRLPDGGSLSRPAETAVRRWKMRRISASKPGPALHYLTAEAKRHELGVTEYILDATYRLWTIARLMHLEDVERHTLQH